MKDIFELLNDIDVEESDIVEMETSDIEKQKVKDNLKISTKHVIVHKKRKLIAIASAICLMIFGGTLTIGIINPTYASDIPIVGDIFKFLDRGKEGIYNRFKENSNEIDIVKKNAGIEIKVTDVIFDGFTVYYTYEIKPDMDLGDELIMIGEDLKIKGYNEGNNGGSQIKKVSPQIYVGQSSRTLNNEMENIECKLKFSELCYRQNVGEGEFKTVKGNWSFNFNLEALPTDRLTVNKSTIKNGIKINIESIVNTPISSIVVYTSEIVDSSDSEFIKSITDNSGWLKGSAELVAVDDCNNIYNEHSTGGGYGKKGVITYTHTFNKIDENANKLTITPKIIFGSKSGEMSVDKDGNEVYSEYSNSIDDIVFDKIEIDLKS